MTTKNRDSAWIEMRLTNPKIGSREVEVEQIALAAHIHDESCAEPEYLRLPNLLQSQSPSSSFVIAGGETKNWNATIPLNQLRRIHAKERRRVLTSAWGSDRADELLQQELATEAWLEGAGVGRLVVRAMRSLAPTGIQTRLLVRTRRDGEFMSADFFAPTTALRERFATAIATRTASPQSLVEAD